MNLGGFAESLKVLEGSEFVKYVLYALIGFIRTYVLRLDIVFWSCVKGVEKMLTLPWTPLTLGLR